MSDDKRITERAFRANEARNSPAKNGRPKVRRLDPTTTDIDYSREEIEFGRAVDIYRRDNNRPFPTCHEYLNILRGLGYQKVGLSA